MTHVNSGEGMRTQRPPNDRSGTQRQTEKRGKSAVPPDPTARQRNRAGGSGKPAGGASESVQYSPSGDPDQRRDDDVQPSPEGPNTRGRGDSDVEGIHDRSTSVERE
jgi:hypothetical protein